MRRSIAAFVALLCVGLCLNAAAGLCVVKTDTGYYNVTQGPDGKPAYEAVTVVDLTGGGHVPPPGGGDTPAPPADGLRARTAAAVSGWAVSANHHTSAQALSVLYRTAAQKIEKGDLPLENAFDFAREGATLILEKTEGTAAYAPFRKSFTDYATAEIQAGRLQSRADYAEFFHGAADGLDAGAAEAPALNPVLMQVILTIVLMLLRRFIPGLDIPGDVPTGL